MRLEDLYKVRDIRGDDRIRERNILVILPEKGADLTGFLDQTGFDRCEIAITWPKDRIQLWEEIALAKPKVIVQYGGRVSKKYPFVDGKVPDELMKRMEDAVADKFVNLHHHDEYSLKDALGTVNQLVKLLKRQRRSFCCVTNHGSVGGWIKQYLACQKAGIKPIFGMEAYVSNYRGDDPAIKREHRSARHLVLLAKNKEGFDNILRIHNDAQLNGFYYSPRTTHEMCKEWGKGIIATSACMGGEIPHVLMRDPLAGDDEEEFRENQFKEAKAIYDTYNDAFDEFYIEIQIIEFEMQREANRRLIKFAKRVGAPLILSCDSHYLDKNYDDTHDLLMYIRQGKTKLDGDVDKDEDVWDFEVRALYYRSYEQMVDVFENGFAIEVSGNVVWKSPFKDDVFTEEIFQEATSNTLSVARRVDHIEMDNTVKLPKLYSDPRQELKEKVNKGFRALGLNKRKDRQAYLDRVRHEFDVICKLGWADYFLVMERIVSMAKEEFKDEVGEWAIGYGRGCFHPSTRVVMANGVPKFIGDINVGEKVIADDSSIQEVSEVHTYDVDEVLLEVEVDDGRLVRCTADHEWKVSREGREVWVQAKDLRDGDDIVEV